MTLLSRCSSSPESQAPDEHPSLRPASVAPVLVSTLCRPRLLPAHVQSRRLRPEQSAYGNRGECLPLRPATTHPPLRSPSAPRHFDAARSVSHSVAPARPRSPSRTVPNTVRVPSTPNRRRSSRCGLPCGAVCGAVPLGRRSRRPPIQLPPRPSAVAVAVAVVADAVPIQSLSFLFRSSLKLSASSSLLSPIADAVPNRTFETLGRIAARVSALKPRLPAVAVAVVVAVGVAEAAAARPLADAVAVGPRPVLSPSPSPSLPHSRNTPSAR